MRDRINQNRAGSRKSSGLPSAKRKRAQRNPRCLFEALEGRALLSASVLAVPTALTATASAPTTVQLHWKDNDSTATGYYVLRSTDGVHYTQVSKLTSGAAGSFTDATALSGHVYDYEIQAYKGTTNSAVSTRATVTTPLTAVSGLTASATSPKAVQLSWTDNDSSATGYYVLRTTDGVHFTEIASLTSATVKTYTDATALSGHAYQYEVEAFDAATTAPASKAASALTPLTAVSGLTTSATGPKTVQLSWTDNDSSATGYYVLRATDGVHFTKIASVTSATAKTYSDTTALSGHAYQYEVEAFDAATTAPTSKAASVVTPLAAVSGLTASATGPKTVQLNWTDNDSSATGYYVLRATDGVHFTEIASLTSATVKTYTDATALSGHAYQYEVEAFDAATTSPASKAASVVTPLAAPTGLTASLSGLTIKLTWTDADSSATGYYVLRSTDNVHFSQLAALNTGSANSYSDSATAYGTTYYYKVEAFNAIATSAASGVASKATPASGVSIAKEFGDELVITAAGVDDSISVSESGYTFTITADGTNYTDAATTAGLFIYTRGGTDTINIAKSVTSDATLETIDGAATTITSAGADVTAWIDSTDIYSGTGDVHRVATFAGGVSKATGAALANPKDAGATVKVSASLFGTGPIAADVNQGEVGDCYFLSSLAAFAGQDPNVLVQSAVDMGDGTYVVQFMSNNKPTFVRVSNAFSTGPFGGFMYAHPGSDGTIWAMVMEKAFAYFRTGANTYASINSGWMGEVYGDFGVSSTNFFTSSYTATTLFNLLSADLAGGDAITLGTSQSPPNLVGDHAYTLVSVYKDSAGVAHYVVRNPWGVSGDALENSQGYATLTFAQMVANFVDGCA